MSDEADTAAKPTQPTPPYTSFGSLKSSLSVLSEHGVPNRIDRSVWGNRFSGAVVGQVLTAYRFLRLVDPGGAPTTWLTSLVSAYGGSNWPAALKAVIERCYSDVLDLDLQKTTASQIYERFRTAYGAEGETGRKCVTFFLHAAQEAAIPVSNYLLSSAKPRAAVPKRRVKMARAAEMDAVAAVTPAAPTPSNSMTDRLLEKFPEFDPTWPDDIKAKWFASFSELMDRTKA